MTEYKNTSIPVEGIPETEEGIIADLTRDYSNEEKKRLILYLFSKRDYAAANELAGSLISSSGGEYERYLFTSVLGISDRLDTFQERSQNKARAVTDVESYFRFAKSSMEMDPGLAKQHSPFIERLEDRVKERLNISV